MPQHDVIVVGLGALGCVVSHDLAARGLDVLGLDRFEPGHDRGSSHGQTRVIRQAYFEHPDYVPLLQRAYERWADLERWAQRQLYYPVGVLEVGPADGVVVPGVLQAAKQHDLRVQELSGAEIERRFAGITALGDSGLNGVFEQDAGYLSSEESVRQWAARARQRGASLEIGAAVTAWRQDGEQFVVASDAGEHRAEQLVLCPGAWAPQLLPAWLAGGLHVRRKVLCWYGADRIYHQDTGFPVWLFEKPEGIFYGFPTRDSTGLKAARHSGGHTTTDPLHLDRELRGDDHLLLDNFLAQHLPQVDSTGPSSHAVCMYTMSADEHFIVGADPEVEGLWYGAGLSGHGFKLVPALGELLATGIATGRDPSPPLFRPGRFRDDA